MSVPAPNEGDAPVLRNLLLTLLASALWIGNWLAYFARDLGEWWQRRQERRDFWAGFRPESHKPVQGPLGGEAKRSFPPPPPPPPPVRDIEELPRRTPRRR